ncbi:NADH:ubiquinone reductase (Na(+)-transporting) subunit B [Thorsellia anophelis]|uniref:Na(+)-translocating NADH-quinone reductase subunit B n=1 Tax=Thorsellia anophelis DSM 18579 TaxID=1123402 RepID=A0A1H9YMH2_9GAMM|nr:NADH:ubiquinone reductase (Na(+)-transporting) subunit B [Thorsellia anophelis]SES70250.1 Na+-transporting NADH:ubiquinone oxidoreductase subunit B [Thorsellia anophelis DSM 18579]
MSFLKDLIYSNATEKYLRTKTTSHVRDGVSLKRAMTWVCLWTIPAVFFAWWNVGYQANLVFDANPQLISAQDNWRIPLLNFLVGFDPNNFFANVVHGALYFFPIFITCLAVGGIIEVTFVKMRNHLLHEGFMVSATLFTLSVPPTIPLWMVAVAIAFGVIVGKEVFGGTGMNFLNPALVARAFLFFAYPTSMTGDSIWIAAQVNETVQGFSGATPLALAQVGGVAAIEAGNFTWLQAFLGFMPGSLGETSTLALMIGGLGIIAMRIASWRIVLSGFIGLIAMSYFFNLIGSSTNPMFAMPWYWHMVLGGFALGIFFMATDPVSASMTDTGKWVYGFFIGASVVFLRVLNPSFPESVMLAILLGNLCAPLIDYFVVKANIKRRSIRNG